LIAFWRDNTAAQSSPEQMVNNMVIEWMHMARNAGGRSLPSGRGESRVLAPSPRIEEPARVAGYRTAPAAAPGLSRRR